MKKSQKLWNFSFPHFFVLHLFTVNLQFPAHFDRKTEYKKSAGNSNYSNFVSKLPKKGLLGSLLIANYLCSTVLVWITLGPFADLDSLRNNLHWLLI